MSTTRISDLEEILDIFAGYYDIERIEEQSPLVAKAVFHQSTEKYVLSKRAKLWEVNVHEYVYFFELDDCSLEQYKTCLQIAYEEGMKLIEPGPDHMYSYITVVFVGNSFDSKALKALEKCRIHKDFKLSFHGWMDVRTVALNKGNHTIHTNRMGKDLKKLFQRFLQSN